MIYNVSNYIFGKKKTILLPNKNFKLHTIIRISRFKYYICIILYILFVTLQINSNSIPKQHPFSLVYSHKLNKIQACYTFSANMGYTILKKLYPSDITSIIFDAKIQDWKIGIKNKDNIIFLFWANGKLLPEEELHKKEIYQSFFYYYPFFMPNPSQFSSEKISFLYQQTTKTLENKYIDNSTKFFDIIYDGNSANSIEKHIQRIDFLGKRVSIHKKIIPALQRVEKNIYELAKTNKDIENFIKEIQRIDGYNWRDVRSSSNRSFHSWGLAIDILPNQWNKKYIYWKWIIESGNDKWISIPLSRRWNPPHEIITIFESEGFIWGGKWDFWDNMHFEYRPEILHFRETIDFTLK